MTKLSNYQARAPYPEMPEQPGPTSPEPEEPMPQPPQPELPDTGPEEPGLPEPDPDPTTFNMRKFGNRFEGEDPWKDFFQGCQRSKDSSRSVSTL